VFTQPGKQHDLHGSAPDNHSVALLLIDVINHFEFARGEELFEKAFPIAKNIACLKQRAQAAGVPVIYVNDNFGRWQSSFDSLLNYCLEEGTRGHKFVEQLRPDANNYLVLKPKHSAFYQTPLDLLLKHLGAERVILAGVSTNSCILFTANDAYMRDLEIAVPEDCVAACNVEEHDYAIRHMHSMLKADTSPCDRLEFAVPRED
jgi:nicotinamidase-related amidase